MIDKVLCRWYSTLFCVFPPIEHRCSRENILLLLNIKIITRHVMIITRLVMIVTCLVIIITCLVIMNIIAKDKVLFSVYECLFGLVRTFYTFSHNQRECAEILHFDTLSTKFIYKLKSVFRPYHLYLVPFAI